MAPDRTGSARRRFLQVGLASAGLSLLSGCGMLPSRVQQPAKVPRIGYLTINSQANTPANLLDAFRAGLRQAGYVEGQTVGMDYRWADSRAERLSELAVELVQQQVDIILTAGTVPLQAARRATSTIPIVMANAGDPVGLGIVVSLARPGGNVTGLTTLSPDLAPKRLQLLQQSVPGISRIGVLHNPDDPGRVRAFQETEGAARTLGLQVRPLELRASDDLAALLADAVGEHVDALIVLQGGPVNAVNIVVGMAAQHRLPAMYDGGQFTDAGGLMYYGPNFPDLYGRAAAYVVKILEGAKPGDLPIEQPSRFDFIIHLKTAQTLGLTIPPSVLQQVTEVIQ